MSTPTPALVRWFGYCAVALLLALPLSIVVVRAGLWQPGLLIYALACLGAGLALALAVVLLLLPKLAPWRRQLLIGSLALLPGTVLLVGILASRGDYPAIHDVSTDLQNPPVFNHAASLRGPGTNSLEPNPEAQAKQRTAYPGVETITIAAPRTQAWEQALATAAQLGWDVVYRAPDESSFEAVATTRLMGFKDDVVVRLQAGADGGTDIDLRSVSRVGVGDLGANAGRIDAFAQHIQR